MGGPLGESGEHRVLNVAVHLQRIQLGIVWIPVGGCVFGVQEAVVARQGRAADPIVAGEANGLEAEVVAAQLEMVGIDEQARWSSQYLGVVAEESQSLGASWRVGDDQAKSGPHSPTVGMREGAHHCPCAQLLQLCDQRLKK